MNVTRMLLRKLEFIITKPLKDTSLGVAQQLFDL